VWLGWTRPQAARSCLAPHHPRNQPAPTSPSPTPRAPAALAAALTAIMPGMSGARTGSTMMSLSSADPRSAASPVRMAATREPPWQQLCIIDLNGTCACLCGCGDARGASERHACSRKHSGSCHTRHIRTTHLLRQHCPHLLGGRLKPWVYERKPQRLLVVGAAAKRQRHQLQRVAAPAGSGGGGGGGAAQGGRQLSAPHTTAQLPSFFSLGAAGAMASSTPSRERRADMTHNSPSPPPPHTHTPHLISTKPPMSAGPMLSA
jgi:hypothetical protein